MRQRVTPLMTSVLSLVTLSVSVPLIFAIPVTLPAQAQTRPIGINSRIPGVDSLGKNPGFKGANGQQSGYYADVCNRRSGGQYGKLIHAQPYYNGNISCAMERGSFLVTYKQQYYPR